MLSIPRYRCHGVLTNEEAAITVPRRPRTLLALGVVITVVVAVVAIPAIAAGIGGGTIGAPHFVDEATTAGIDHVYDGDFEFYVGGGVAVFDCDDDGRPDLYFAGGTNPATLYRNESPVGGALRFTELTDPVTDQLDVTGAYPLDIDGDGRIDLAVLRRGGNALLKGLGDCRFERANEAWTFGGGDAWTTAFSAKWEGTNALPTLAFGNYLDETTDGSAYRCLDGALVRPDPAGSGYAAPVPLTPSWCSLSMLFSDWDRSGRVDLRVSNDRHYYRDYSGGQEQLWRVAAGEPPRLYTEEEGWADLNVWGMGIASYDVTGDGYPEYFLTSQSDNKLQTLADGPSRPTYRDIALQRGVLASRPYAGDTDLPSTAWHAEFQDVNNDGLVDLFVAKGNVEVIPDYAAKDPSNLLLGQPDGTFTESAEKAGILSFARARGAALADLNLDGMLDLVEVNRRENVSVWRNVGSGDATRPAALGDWLAIHLDQPGPNRDAIGAWVEVKAGERTLRREVTVGGGHAGGQLGWIHFGLGAADTAQVRVQWPGGETGPWLDAAANQFVVVERGATEARPWSPP
jgi:enediyne biosynthesis protein E4